MYKNVLDLVGTNAKFNRSSINIVMIQLLNDLVKGVKGQHECLSLDHLASWWLCYRSSGGVIITVSENWLDIT